MQDQHPPTPPADRRHAKLSLTAVRLYQVLLAAALLVPAALFGSAAYQNRIETLRAGNDTIVRTAAIMHEHARKVFETQELALDQIDERLDGRTLDEIAVPETSNFLARLQQKLEQVVSIWVAGPNGSILAGSQPWSPGSSIAGRDFFIRQRDADAGLYISEPFVGAATQKPSFAISRRLDPAEPGFHGTIHVAASPEYFQRFYAEASPPYEHFAALIRADGFILASDPPLPQIQRLQPGGTFIEQITRAPAAGSFRAKLSMDGLEREWSYRRVGSYPAYVIFGVKPGVTLRQWYANLWTYGTFASLAALTLLVVSWLALNRARAEQVALLQLRRESTQRQAAEQQLRHVQRLEAVGQLTGGIAHDFNNLMTAILGNLELIGRAAATIQPDPAAAEAGTAALDKIKRLASAASGAVLRGSKLTKSLLAFSRSQPLQTEPVDVNALLHEFVDLVRQAVGARVQVSLHLDPVVPPAWADAPQLEAAVLNLCINARDAMQGGGSVNIVTSPALMTASDLAGNPEAKPGRFVRIAIEDSGSGMPADVAAKAFEPFFTTKPIGQGTGLGLSQVFGFVRQLGGHVTIVSEIGRGTTVSLFLPLAPVSA